MSDFIAALERAQASGSTVLLASFDDAQERPAVRLKVLRVFDKGTRFDIEHENQELRSYRTLYALWIEDEHGRTENPEAQKKLLEYQARRQERAERQAQLRDLSIPLDSTAKLVELHGTHNGAEKTYYAFRDKYSQRTAVFLAKPTHAARLLTLIGESASVWSAIDMLLQGEFLWPIWVQQHEAEHADSAEPHDYEAAFAWSQRTPSDIIQMFFAKGWKRHQVFMPNPDHIDKRSADLLRRSRLVVAAKKAPIEALLAHLPANDLKAPMKARGVKPGNKEAVQKYYAENMDAEYESQLRASPWLEGRECFLPPAGFTWESWHDFRTAYADMYDALIGWTAGNFEAEKYAALV